MAVPRHMFTNLTDEFPGVREKLQKQARLRVGAALEKLLEDGVVSGRDVTYGAGEQVHPRRDSDNSRLGAGAGIDAGLGTLLVVRGGELVLSAGGGGSRVIKKGEVCLCGSRGQDELPPRGLIVTTAAADTNASVSPGVPRGSGGAQVVEVPVKDLMEKGVFPSPLLDAFLGVVLAGTS
ncbi:unnamed protein product [Discosporangium mesarthrocarpum]